MKNDPAVLRRLGPVPFWRGERKCLDVLGDIYRRAMDAAAARLPLDFRTKIRYPIPHEDSKGKGKIS